MHWVFYALAFLCLGGGGVSLSLAYTTYGAHVVILFWAGGALLGAGVLFLSIAAVVGALHRIASRLERLAPPAPAPAPQRTDA